MLHDRRQRRSIRLPRHDYRAPRQYFLTLCTYQRLCLFGEVHGGKVRLSEYGRVVVKEWQQAAQLRQEINLDAWVVMPNHLHGIVEIAPQPQSSQPSPIQAKGIATRLPKSLSTFVSGFKAAVTRHINTLRQAPGTPVWQRNYYEHIVRNDADLNRIRQYIAANPSRWREDELHPQNLFTP